MEAKNKKKMKNQQSEDEKYELDRLSCLPEGILSHILSFLDTKSAIRTSVLSKHYRLAWTFSPSLDFKLVGFDVDSYNSFDVLFLPPFRSPTVSSGSFELHVNRVLQRREHCHLTSFRLSLHVPVGSEFIERCIDYAVRHNVQHLRIRGNTKRGRPATLPRLLLTSSSLITLHLSNGYGDIIQLPKSVILPNLKVLHLKNFVFSDNNYNGEVFSGCPSLEDLVLSKCSIRRGDKLKSLDVNCLNLKNLEIRYWRSPLECFDEHMINVNAPRLVFFKFQGYLARVNFKDGVPCLDEACIDLCCPTECSSERMIRTSESLFSILCQIRHVKFLSMSSKTIEYIFKNLKLIKFIAENIYKEMTMPIKNVKELLKRAGHDPTIFCKEHKLSSSEFIPELEDANASLSVIPPDVIHFFLESSPSAEFISIARPKPSPSAEVQRVQDTFG
ncbi:hypothetical protein Pfo_017330 [Paulownia fortunei]|nr:hypothetical protein Pfo_017330 [Paulownia fortunei]